MRGRGPRGLPVGPGLIPVAWGHIGWASGVAYWLSKGGRAGQIVTASTSVIAVEILGGGPKERRHVSLVSHDESEPWAYHYADSTDSGAVLATDGTSVGLSIVVYEEQ